MARGFRADLRRVCGCPLQIVGKTDATILENLRRHAMDVHEVSEMPEQFQQKLEEAMERIQPRTRFDGRRATEKRDFSA